MKFIPTATIIIALALAQTELIAAGAIPSADNLVQGPSQTNCPKCLEADAILPKGCQVCKPCPLPKAPCPSSPLAPLPKECPQCLPIGEKPMEHCSSISKCLPLVPAPVCPSCIPAGNSTVPTNCTTLPPVCKPLNTTPACGQAGAPACPLKPTPEHNETEVAIPPSQSTSYSPSPPNNQTTIGSCPPSNDVNTSYSPSSTNQNTAYTPVSPACQGAVNGTNNNSSTPTSTSTSYGSSGSKGPVSASSQPSANSSGSDQESKQLSANSDAKSRFSSTDHNLVTILVVAAGAGILLI